VSPRLTSPTASPARNNLQLRGRTYACARHQYYVITPHPPFTLGCFGALDHFTTLSGPSGAFKHPQRFP
jgi:hypothetical protein